MLFFLVLLYIYCEDKNWYSGGRYNIVIEFER